MFSGFWTSIIHVESQQEHKITGVQRKLSRLEPGRGAVCWSFFCSGWGPRAGVQGTESSSFSTRATCPSIFPTALYIPQHLNHHQRQWRHGALTHSATHTHLCRKHTQKCRNNFSVAKLFNEAQFLFLSNIWWPVATFPLPTLQRQTSRKPQTGLQQHTAKALWLFLYGYKLMIGQVVCTAQGKVNSSGGHSLIHSDLTCARGLGCF